MLLSVIWVALLVGHFDNPFRERQDRWVMAFAFVIDSCGEMTGVNPRPNRSVPDIAIGLKNLPREGRSERRDQRFPARPNGGPPLSKILVYLTDRIGTDLNNPGRTSPSIHDLDANNRLPVRSLSKTAADCVNDGALGLNEHFHVALGFISRAFSFAKGNEYQAGSNYSDAGAYYGSNSHGARPSGHGLLGFKIAYVALAIVNGLTFLGLTVFRPRRLKEDALAILGYVGWVSILFGLSGGFLLYLGL